MPPNMDSYKPEDYDEVLDCIEKMISDNEKDGDDEVVVVLGADMNTRIGTRMEHEEDAKEVIGPYGERDMNPRGEKVAQWMMRLNLVSTASFFDDPKGLRSWINEPDRDNPHTNDYMFTLKRDFKRVRDS